MLTLVACGPPESDRPVSAQIQAPADVSVDWHNVMAVAIPAKATCEFPDFGLAGASGGSSATDRALVALADAVSKAAEHAAIQRALTNIDAELLQTRRRLRLLEASESPATRAGAPRQPGAPGPERA